MKGLAVRLLWPFFLDVRHAKTAAFSGFVSQPQLQEVLEHDGVWKRREQLDPDYIDGALPNAPMGLFQASRGGGYYTLTSDFVLQQLEKLQFANPDLEAIRLDLYSTHPVELFISPQGVGIFSIAFSATRQDGRMLSIAESREIVSRLHFGTWQNATPNSRAAILRRRLTPDGGLYDSGGELYPEPFTLSNVRDDLVTRPLQNFHLAPLHRSFFTYSVLRFGAEIDFDLPAIRDRFVTSLRAVQSHWHPAHAGSLSGDFDFCQAVLNRRHWAAAGQEGATHFVADQRVDENAADYDDRRAVDAFHKYFVPYLIAALQRLTVLQLTHLAADLSTQETRLGDAGQRANENSQDAASELRRHLLRFAVWGQVAQVQVSGVGHEFYRLSQQALEVAQTWEHARSTFSSLDALHAAGEQKRLLQEICNTQNKVEWIELAILGFYSIELFHALNAALGSEVHHGAWWQHLLYGATYLAASALGIVAAYLALGLDKHHDKGEAACAAEGTAAKSAMPDAEGDVGWRRLARGSADLWHRFWSRPFLKKALLATVLITAFNFALAHVPWSDVARWFQSLGGAGTTAVPAPSAPPVGDATPEKPHP